MGTEVTSFLTETFQNQCTVCYILLFCCFRGCGSKCQGESSQDGSLDDTDEQRNRVWVKSQIYRTKTLKLRVFYYYHITYPVLIEISSKFFVSISTNQLVNTFSVNGGEFSDGWMVPPKGNSFGCAPVRVDLSGRPRLGSR